MPRRVIVNKYDLFLEYVDGQIRREMPRENGICRIWHENGTLQSEWRKVKGKGEGLQREWHDNGQLAAEFSRVDGLLQGEVKKWSRDGKLLGQYRMEKGRGTEYYWNDDGTLLKEIEIVVPNFLRAKIFDDLGKAHEIFMIGDKKISRKRFYERVQVVRDFEASRT